MLLLNNEEIRQILTMEMVIQALEDSYTRMIRGEAVCRPRIDLQIPTGDPKKTYRWGTMEGGAAAGYFAIRMKSDITYELEYHGTKTLEKYCVEPGRFCGLVFLFRVDNGEPLAIMNDGFLQHLRVGADSALGVKYMAKEKASVVGMFGSGGMARSHIEAFIQVRPIKKIKVYSPTKEHREAYAKEMEERYEIETIPLPRPEEVYQGVDILCGCTDARIPVILGHLVEKGTHIVSVGGRPDRETYARIDRYLRLGNATPPLGEEETTKEFITYVTPKLTREKIKKEHNFADGVVKLIDPEKVVYLKDILAGKPGRLHEDDITYSERGNLQGAQFYAVAGKIYEEAKKHGLGKEIPTEWFLQDIRD